MTCVIKQSVLLLFLLSLVLLQVHGSGDNRPFPLDPGNGMVMEGLTESTRLNSDSEISSFTWTFMIYMDADNNLEPYALADFMEAMTVTLSPSLNILIQMDRVSGYSMDYEDWKICHRFVLSPHMTPVESNAVSDWGDGAGGREVNMGDPKTLSDFVNWGITNYPATHYAVILWNHGDGWRSAPKTSYRAICYDSTSRDYLYTCEMRGAFEDVPFSLDIIGLDACLMSMVEVAYEIRNEGSILIASEANVPVAGWPYDLIFQDASTSPTLDPGELSKTIVRRYGESYNMDNTLSATDLTQMDSLAQGINSLTSSLMDDNQHWACVAASRNAASFYDDREEYRDLRGFVQALYECSTNDTIRDKAQALKNILDTACIANQFPAYLPSHGLSIYFPDPHKTNIDGGYTCPNIQYACDTNWKEFLYAFLEADTIPPSIEHVPLTDTLETSGPYHVEADIQDESGIREAIVYWGKNGGGARKRAMRQWNGKYVMDITDTSVPGDHYCYRIEARDTPGNIAYFPGPRSEMFWCYDIGEGVEGLWEEFDGAISQFDLGHKRVTFIPDPLDPRRYQTCVEAISDWSVDPEGGAPLFLGDDAFAPLTIHSAPVFLYGNPYNKIYVGSNGYLTFVQGDKEYSPSLHQHFLLPRISPIFTDFNPTAGGGVRYKELQDRLVITFKEIREYDKPEKNNFQVELFYFGGIRMSYLDMGVTSGIVGISNGQGTPKGIETDFSPIESCADNPPPYLEIKTPSQSEMGYVEISYTLYDENANAGNIRVLYSKDGGLVWFAATDAPQGERRWGLESSQAGMDHIYVWNSLLALGEGLHENVKIRMIPYNPQGAGSSSETGIFTVLNPAQIEIKEYLLNASGPPAVDLTKLDVNKDGLVDIADILMVITNDL